MPIDLAEIKVYAKTQALEKYIGCYKDTVDRDIGPKIGDKLSPYDCFKKGQEKGFKYVGL